MKKVIFGIVFLFVLDLFSCSVQHPIDSGLSGEAGVLQVSIHMAKVGALEKAMKTTNIEMAKLYVDLSATGQPTIYDTIQLSGGNWERSIGKTYPGLTASIGGQSVEWTLSVTARDQNNRSIYFGDTMFTIPPLDTINVLLFLNARYSVLVANYYPIRDSVTRCALWIDGDSIANSSFPKQSLIGHTVSLSYDYLTASPTGIAHHIDVKVFGVMAGKEMQLFAGDSTIVVQSGEDKTYDVTLGYAGPLSGTFLGAMTMTAMLGNVGRSTFNAIIPGILDTLPRYNLTLTSSGNGSVSPAGTRVVIQGVPYPIFATADQGYYFSGWQVTSGSAIFGNPTAASTTAWLINGNSTVRGIFEEMITFQKTFGGSSAEEGYSVKQTRDGGYIIAGSAQSLGAGNMDVYLIKTNADGDTTWTKTFGGANDDYGYSVQQTNDGGYIVAGSTNTLNGMGIANAYLIKTDLNGNAIWIKTYRGTDWCAGNSVQQTRDGGYIIAGENYSLNEGGWDIYLIKTNDNGDTIWTKTYGGAAAEIGYSVQQTRDEGYIITGYTYSYGAGSADVYLVKTNVDGNVTWTNTFGGSDGDIGNSVQQTSDGGYIITGYTISFGNGGEDVYLIKTDANGNAIWTKTFGGSSNEIGYSVQQTHDDGYIVAGSTNTFGAGAWDFYLIKTNADGDAIWTKRFGGSSADWGKSVQQTSDGGFILTGYTSSFGANKEIYLIKTDENGDVH